MRNSIIAALLCVLVICSCVGTDTGIIIKNDGSGSLKISYRMAKELESLGKFDGNERWLPVPAGRADWERTVDRVPGLSLASFAVKETEKDIQTTVGLDFTGPDALKGVFDGTGRDFLVDMAGRRLTLYFPAMEKQNAEFRSLFSRQFSGYDFTLTLTLPGKTSVRWLGEDGRETVPPGEYAAEGSSFRYHVPMADLIFLAGPVTMELGW